MNPAIPKIGLGVPVYNGERYLEETLESLLAQTFQDFEIVICDNASTDSTQEICRRFAARDSRIRYFRSQENRGAAPNFNWSFSLARGDYFKFAPYDDLYRPTYLEKCIAALDASPRAVLAHTQSIDIDENGQEMGLRPDAVEFDHPDPVHRFRYMIMVVHACLQGLGVIRREVLATTPVIGSFVSSDRALLAELCLHGPFIEVPEPLFLHREHRQRSQNAIPNAKERIRWFDTRKKAGKAFPSSRLLLEYAKGIRRSPLAPLPKAKAYLQIARWIRWYYPRLLDDFR